MQIVISSEAIIGEGTKEFEALLENLQQHYQPPDMGEELLQESKGGRKASSRQTSSSCLRRRFGSAPRRSNVIPKPGKIMATAHGEMVAGGVKRAEVPAVLRVSWVLKGPLPACSEAGEKRARAVGGQAGNEHLVYFCAPGASDTERTVMVRTITSSQKDLRNPLHRIEKTPNRFGSFF